MPSVGGDGEIEAISTTKALSTFLIQPIFLFFGGFAFGNCIACCKNLIEKLPCGLLQCLRASGSSCFLAICLVTAVLSMWISNTATAAMMLPLALGFAFTF